MFKRLLAAVLAFLAMSAFAAVDVNKATPAELDAVKGIGPAIAGRIVEARKTGPFKDWNDLVTRVKGIGEGNAAKFSEAGLTVNGASFKGASAKPAAAAATTPAAQPAAASAKPDPKAEAEKKEEDAKAGTTAASAAKK